MFDTAPSLKTVLVSLIGFAGLAGLLWVSFSPDPVPVDDSPVILAPMQVTIDVDGRTRVREVYEIAAPLTGLARRAPVSVGDAVVAGDTVVAIVEPLASGLLDTRSRLQATALVSEAEAALQVAETELRLAQEERGHAKTQFDRAQTLVARGVSSLVVLEDATQALAWADAKVDAAAARIDMARSELNRAQAALVTPLAPGVEEDKCCVELLAPVDGVVLGVDVVSERPVTAGARMATIGDPADLEIVADLLSSDAVRLAPGAEALVERWGGDTALTARLRRIEPKARTDVSALGIEEQRVYALFDITTPPSQHPGLGDGFSVFLRIVEWQTDAALQIPLSATFRVGDEWAVFVMEDGLARQRTVTLGRSTGRMLQVLDGLAAGERVITHPSDALVDGGAVIKR